MRIFVANLPFTTTEEELSQLFASYGRVEHAQIIINRGTGRSRGYRFVEMPDATEAQTAINGLNGTVFGGRTIHIDVAHQREEREPRWRPRRPEY